MSYELSSKIRDKYKIKPQNRSQHSSAQSEWAIDRDNGKNNPKISER